MDEKRREKWTRYMRTYRAKHPEKVSIARKKQYITRKIRAMDLLGGAKCVMCGCDELSFLEFNHSIMDVDYTGETEIRKNGIIEIWQKSENSTAQ